MVWGEVMSNKALAQQTSIYTEEVCAIKLAIDIINDNNIRRAVIFSNSCSAVTKMETVQFDNQFMRQLQHQIYANKRTGYQTQICWIPGHCNIIGKEKADLAAKQAAKRVPNIASTALYGFLFCVTGEDKRPMGERVGEKWGQAEGDKG